MNEKDKRVDKTRTRILAAAFRLTSSLVICPADDIFVAMAPIAPLGGERPVAARIETGVRLERQEAVKRLPPTK